MTREEISDLLSVAAGFDLRTVGDDDVDAWQMALDDRHVPNLGLSEAVDGVVMHYQTSRERVMPVDILKYVKAARADAITRALPAGKPNRDAYARVQQLLDGRSKAARAERTANRTAVLAHPDLAARLCEPPIGYKTPEQWSGVIPPEQWREQHNDCPRRAALVELVAEARAREARKDADHA